MAGLVIKRALRLDEVPLHHTSDKPGCFVSICPNCNDVSGHLEINTLRNIYYCMRCGQGGRLYGDGVEERRGMPLDEEAVPTWNDGEPVLKGTPPWKYLEERGFNETLIRDLEPKRGPEPWRIYFPIRDSTGEVVMQMARAFHYQAKPKWWVSKSKPGLSEHLGGLHRLQHGEEEIVLVEGLFDAVWDRKRVCMFGSSLSLRQTAILISLHPKSITVALDSDKYDVARGLASGVAMLYTAPVFVVKLPMGQDPCDLGFEGTAYIEENKESIL